MIIWRDDYQVYCYYDWNILAIVIIVIIITLHDGSWMMDETTYTLNVWSWMTVDAHL